MAKQVMSFEPEGLGRRERKQLARDVAALQAVPVTAREAQVDNDLPVESPLGGGPNPFLEDRSYWNNVAVAQPTHQATSLTLAGVYPFLADPPVEASGPVLGIDVRSGGEFSLDPWEWYNRGRIQSANFLLIGGIGQGKSHFAKAWACRSMLFGRQSIIPSDSKGEWGRTAEFVGGQVVRLGGENNVQMNPLDAGPRRTRSHDEDHRRAVESRRRSVLVALIDTLLPDREKTAPAEHTVLDWALDLEIALTGDKPTIGGVYRRLIEASPTDAGYYNDILEDKRRLQHTLRRLVQGDLAGLFDGHSTVELDVTSPMTVIDTEAIGARGDTALALAQICTNAWVRAAINDKHSGRKFFIFREEGWRDMNSVAALQQQRLQLKLGREYGISSVFILHKVSDIDAVGAEGSEERGLAEAILGDIGNTIIFRQESGELPRTRRALGITAEESEEIKKLQRGVALIRMKDRTFVVNSYLTSTTLERELFKSDEAMAERSDDSETDQGAMIVVPNDDLPKVRAAEDMGAGIDDDLESTIVIDRRPQEIWRLETDDGFITALNRHAAVLGRNPAELDDTVQTIKIPDNSKLMSKTHARLELVDGQWTVTDLDSTNGVYVEAEDGTQVPVKRGATTPVLERFSLGGIGVRIHHIVEDAA